MNRHHRHSMRLKEYDYTNEGGYFVTVVTQGRETLFGEVVNEEMILNEFGKIVENTWFDLIHHNLDIELDEFIVMPNHVHWIIIIEKDSELINTMPTSVGAGSEPAPTRKHQSLSEIVRQFKTFSARRINQLRNTPGLRIWQRNFYDHIIRDEKDYENIANYIALNPLGWDQDKENIR